MGTRMLSCCSISQLLESFLAFVIKTKSLRNEIEGVLIAAMPTANGAKPRLKKARIPDVVSRMSRDIYEHQANPRLEFDKLTDRLRKMEQLLRKRKPRKAKSR